MTPKFNIAYEPTDYLTLYATAAEGFRPGGVNPGIPVSCNVPSQGYNPDTVWSYEGGEKWRSHDGRLVVNSDFYYTKWKDIQQLVTPPCGFGYTANAGNAETYGPEVEFAYKLTRELSLDASGTYTHANITSAASDSSFTVGQRILNIPQYQAHVRLAYTKSILDNLRLTVMAEDTFVGDTEDISYTTITLPAYSIADLRLSLERDAKTLTFYINNVANTHAEISANNTGLTPNIPSLYRISTNQPLPGGVSLRYSSLAGKAGVSKEIRDRLQNNLLHDVSSKSYDCWNYMPEKRAGMVQWDRFVRALLSRQLGDEVLNEAA